MPTATGLDIITRSLREAGVTGGGDTPSSDQAEDGFNTLNGMIDSWKVDSRYIYCDDIADRKSVV